MSSDSKKNLTFLSVEIRDTVSLLFEGEATGISSTNKKGLFDILPIHENFISVVLDEVVVHTRNGDKRFPNKTGILKVSENEVKGFLNIETVEEEVLI